MAITDSTVALFSIGSSAVVATAGILVPLAITRSNHRHERQLRVADQRVATYIQISEIIHAFDRGDPIDGWTKHENEFARMTIWASDEVTGLFGVWKLLLAESTAKPIPPDHRERVKYFVNKLETTMRDEVQAIESRRSRFNLARFRF